jgi:hypothetical protein
MLKILAAVIHELVKHPDQRCYVSEVKNLLKDGWPISCNKEKTLEDIKKVINEQVVADLSTLLIDMMACQTRTAPKLIPTQKEDLESIVKLIENAPTKKCEHKNIVIGSFVHGGGFTPIFACPELICLDCKLNVTLYKEGYWNNSRRTPKAMGLKITKAKYKELLDWGDKTFEETPGPISANRILGNPIAAYEKTAKWTKPLPLKIIDPDKLQKFSGR